MGRNSSYHFAKIKTDMNPPSDNADSQMASDAEKPTNRSAEIVMELKGYRLEIPSGQTSSLLVGQIRTPRGRVVSNFSPRGKKVEELQSQFVDYINDLLVKIETKFQDDLKQDRIQGKIALRIDPKLHCELKIESTFQDKTLNSYIEEIATQRIPFDHDKPSLVGTDESPASGVIENHLPSEIVPVITQSAIARKLRQSPIAWTRMMSSIVPLAKQDESSDIVTFSEALGQFINTMGVGIDQLSPYLDIHEGDEASLLKALGNMLLEASDALK